MYPIVVNLKGRTAVVVGGGPVAERKVRGLLAAEASVLLISPELVPALAALEASGAIRVERRRYHDGDLAEAALAFAATSDRGVNAAIVADAKSRGILVNDASAAERGDFATPATHRIGPLAVSVDTGGLSPSLAKRIRDEIAESLDPRFGRAALTLGRMRTYVQTAVASDLRATVMQRLAALDVAQLAALNPVQTENKVEDVVQEIVHEQSDAAPAGIVSLVCASRASALAMTQTRTIVAQLAQAGFASTILNISTKGDEIQDRSLAAIGTDSIFVKELELALREGRADFAVHSCKDLPSTLPGDMTIAAIPVREDPRDAYCSEKYPTFSSLPPGARVGTSSPRRRAQLGALRPDLIYDDIRGNVDSRLKKLASGAYDAIVLAMAGLHRLGLAATYTVPFPVHEMTPAVAQGALAIETTAGSPHARAIERALGDPTTTAAVRAERAFLRTLRGGCQAPVGAHATYTDGVLHVVGTIAEKDGAHVVRGERRERVAPDATEALGEALAHDLLARGGAAMLGGAPLAGRVFLLPRTQDRPSKIAPALRSAGAEVVEAVDSSAATAALGARVPDAILFPSSGSVMAITEYLAGLRDNGHRPVVAAMGPSSSERAGESGFPPDVVAPNAEIASFVQAVTRCLLERGLPS